MIEYAVEPLDLKLIGEVIPLQQQYWEEVAGPFHNFPPDVDWATYLLAQQTGRLKCLIGRADGVLVAGTFIVIGPHPHYACILASLPLLFARPEYRRGREGLRLVKLAEEESRKAGAQLMMTHGGAHNGVYRLFEFLKYALFGYYYVKVIGDTKPVFKVR
jgi:GNAT superfamily N-acetyltransferase